MLDFYALKITLFVSLQSLLNFLNDPLGEMPWEEEEGTEDVRHIHTRMVSKLYKVLLYMFQTCHDFSSELNQLDKCV